MSDLIALTINPSDVPTADNVPQIKKALSWLLGKPLNKDDPMKSTVAEMITMVLDYISKKDLSDTQNNQINTQVKNFLQQLAQVNPNGGKFLNKRETWASIAKNYQGSIITALTGEVVDTSYGCRSLRLNVQTIIFICFFLVSVVYPVVLCSYIFSVGEDKNIIELDKTWGPGGSCIELRNGLVGTSIAVNGIITIIVLISMVFVFIGKTNIDGKEQKVGFDYFRNLYVPENFLKKTASKNFDTMTLMNIFIFLSSLSNIGLYLWYFNFIKDRRAENPWYAASWSLAMLNIVFFILWAYCIFYHYKVQKLGPEGFVGR